jgi:hypothetical protein
MSLYRSRELEKREEVYRAKQDLRAAKAALAVAAFDDDEVAFEVAQFEVRRARWGVDLAREGKGPLNSGIG